MYRFVIVICPQINMLKLVTRFQYMFVQSFFKVVKSTCWSFDNKQACLGFFPIKLILILVCDKSGIIAWTISQSTSDFRLLQSTSIFAELLQWHFAANDLLAMEQKLFHSNIFFSFALYLVNENFWTLTSRFKVGKKTDVFFLLLSGLCFYYHSDSTQYPKEHTTRRYFFFCAR